MERFPAAMAASWRASAEVGWPWMVRAMSSAEAPNSRASVHSAIMSAARGADDVDAEHAVGLGVGEELDKSLLLPHAPGPACSASQQPEPTPSVFARLLTSTELLRSVPAADNLKPFPSIPTPITQLEPKIAKF